MQSVMELERALVPATLGGSVLEMKAPLATGKVTFVARLGESG